MIRVEKLNKTFGKTVILDNVNLSIEDGKIYGFIGRNASGKTVLFKILCGFISPTKGDIIIDGKK